MIFSCHRFTRTFAEPFAAPAAREAAVDAAHCGGVGAWVGCCPACQNGTTITVNVGGASGLSEPFTRRAHAKISLYSRTPDFRHRKTERRLTASRQTLGAFVS